jgi:ribosome maturation factor RimP
MRKRATARFCVLKRGFHGPVKKNKRRAKSKVEPKELDRTRAKEQKVIQQVWSLAEPLCSAEGLELIQVEYQRESAGRVLRLYVDKPEGIKLDDCVGVSRQMSDILDVKLTDVGPYSLEVTSPGPERPLAKKEDFDKFKGSRAKIKTYRPINGRKNFTGVLLGVSRDEVSLQINEQITTIGFTDISKARLLNKVENGDI